LAKKKRAAAKKRKPSRRARVDARSNKLVIHLNRDQQAAMKRCLERSGKITISFGKFSTTKLPAHGLPIVPIITD
jgi:hypothetical protein